MARSTLTTSRTIGAKTWVAARREPMSPSCNRMRRTMASSRRLKLPCQSLRYVPTYPPSFTLLIETTASN